MYKLSQNVWRAPTCATYEDTGTAFAAAADLTERYVEVVIEDTLTKKVYVLRQLDTADTDGSK